jgi:aquaporin NIP
MKRNAAEFLGTYALVLFGTGAIVVNELYGGAVTHVGVSSVSRNLRPLWIYLVGPLAGSVSAAETHKRV